MRQVGRAIMNWQLVWLKKVISSPLFPVQLVILLVKVKTLGLSGKRLSMRTIKEVLRLKLACGLSDRQVARSCSIGRATVSEYLRRAEKAGLNWPLPEGMDTKKTMMIGTAGFTAMLCVMTLEEAGITPDKGPVLVTGAAGGVGSVACAILGKLGYNITALTAPGQESTHDYLRSLGVKEIIGGPEWSTLSNDAFPSREFDFMLSNPPYGKSWKSDLERMGGKGDVLGGNPQIEHVPVPFVRGEAVAVEPRLASLADEHQEDRRLGEGLCSRVLRQQGLREGLFRPCIPDDNDLPGLNVHPGRGPLCRLQQFDEILRGDRILSESTHAATLPDGLQHVHCVLLSLMDASMVR